MADARRPIWLPMCLLIAGSLASVDSAEAKSRGTKPAARKTEAVAPRKPRPLDEIMAELPKAHKSKRARAIKKAYAAYLDKKFQQAIKLASEGGNGKADGLFSDYSLWIAAQSHYALGQEAIQAKRYAEAIRAGESAVDSTLKLEARSPYSPMIRFVDRDAGLGEILQGDAQALAKKWPQALASFERGFQRVSLGNSLNLVRPDSLLHYAQACSEKESEFCQSWIGRFASIYPKGSPEMQAVLKVFPGALDRPRPAHNARLTQAYKAPDLDQAAFEAGLALYMDGKFGAAIKGFRQFVDEFPKSAYRFRARYWLAQALTQEQDHEEARKAYEQLQHDSPLTYYGLLAAFASGRDMNAPISPATPNAIERDPYLQPQEMIRLTRAEQFLAEGAREMAALELKELKARGELSSPFLMYVAALNAEAGTHSTAFALLGDLIQRGFEGATSGAFLNLVFPLAHYEHIRKHSAVFGLDPLLVLSLIKQESAFDPAAGSNVGATGLMQLMPATATDTDPDVVRADLVDPDTNVRVGTKYLAQLLTRFKGNIVLALAGYNAGPNAADRWYREHGQKRGMLEFIESIPYRETREYVGAIIRNYYWYSRKMSPEEPAKPLAYFWGQLTSGAVPKASSAPSPEPAPSASPQPSPAPTEPVTVPGAGAPAEQ